MELIAATARKASCHIILQQQLTLTLVAYNRFKRKCLYLIHNFTPNFVKVAMKE